MADLRSVAELAHRQLYPNTTDEAPITLVEFIETAKLEYASQAWRIAIEEKQRDGWANISQSLLTESDPLPVKNNEIDISKLGIMKGLPQETWLQGIGGMDCSCSYVKSTYNQNQLLCLDDSMDDNSKPFLVLGKKIKFPKGTHDKELTIVYAHDGSKVDESVEVEDYIAGIVRMRLIEIYGGKTGREDETNNSNSNT